ncbi:Protein of unknown function (DUF2892) [Chelatococcus sambhunathii]|nr:Protein of unknown function (DUF2892) [Chelatococcus sambhunathii]
MTMTRNIGGIDRAVRIIVGLALLSLVAFVDGDARWWGLLGLVPLLTGLFSLCPLYTLLGVNTCPIRGERR